MIESQNIFKKRIDKIRQGLNSLLVSYSLLRLKIAMKINNVGEKTGSRFRQGTKSKGGVAGRLAR